MAKKKKAKSTESKPKSKYDEIFKLDEDMDFDEALKKIVTSKKYKKK